MKTPEQMAEEFFENWQPEKPKYIRPKARQYALEKVTECFIAGYQAAKDEEVTKDQQIAALWTESIKNMLPSVHEVVLFPSESTRARDAKVVAKMDAAIKKAKDQLADSDKVMPQWISVKDRLPESSVGWTTVYGCILSRWAVQPGFYTKDSGVWVSRFVDQHEDYHNYLPFESVTHWMPLPAAPKGEG